jgi:16S rRNA (cytidine1402-2'-O)-methyltransferase
VVATPIGNLGDLSPRARSILEAADWIAAEDTRVTRKLFSAGAPAPRGRMLPLHAHNEHAQAERIVELLRGNAMVALVSDAGTPAISDPGATVVRAARLAGQPVFAVPGPNAAIAALSVSGLEPSAFLFCGFLPATGERRRGAIDAVRHVPAALVFYESPHRVVEAMADLCTVLGGSRTVVIARELTKRFEELASMPLAQAPGWLTADSHREQGEYVVIVSAPEVVASAELDLEGAAVIDAWLDALLESVSVRDAARIAAKATGLPRDTLYARALSRKPPQ